jgi:DNA-binding response OmpR family regulator
MSGILIVDDEPHLLLLYEKELRAAGYETMTAGTASQGLEYVTTMRPDLVVLDIRLPDMDGLELMRRILDHDSGLPVVLNTAYGRYRDDFKSWAADAYVTKSSDVSALVAAVRECLAARAGRARGEPAMPGEADTPGNPAESDAAEGQG